MTAAAVSAPRSGRALEVISLLWHGRLSWMRIALAIVFGGNTYQLVMGWHVPVPAFEYQGWVFTVVPSGLRDILLDNPNKVAAVVLVLVVLVVIGLATRPALLALALIGLFARAVEVSQGVFDHESSLTTQVLVVLAFAPGTNSISVEHLIRWWHAGRKDLLGYLTAPYRQWGVLLIIGLLAITYTTSGLSKLRFGGFGWLNGETLGFYLRGLTSGETVYVIGGGPATWRDDFGLQAYAYGNFSFGNYHPAALAGIVDWMAHTPAVMIGISVATVLLELCGFLLFIPRLRSLLLIGYIGMHTTIGLLMGLPFVEYQIVCLLLIEWERIIPFVAKWLRSRRGSGGQRDPADEDARRTPLESTATGQPDG